MYRVIWKEKDQEHIRDFDNLAPAMEWAKTLELFVTIKGSEFEIVGKFGVDSIKDGLCPDGVDYNWKKRRI